MNLVTAYVLRDRPWDLEPNQMSFISRGLDCLILRGPTKHLCGYVGMPLKHPACQDDAQDDLIVHGGITFSSLGKEGSPFYRKSKSKSRHLLFWIGFDCAHSGDLSPQSFEILGYKNGTYRDMSYVKKEIEILVEQIIEIGERA